MMNESILLCDIRIRDPHILPVPETGTYHLVFSLWRAEIHPHGGVQMLTSRDLIHWQGPHVVFGVSDDCWGRAGVWAPEMHAYRGW